MKTSWRKADEERYGEGFDYKYRWQFPSYIRELACHAAVEINNLIRGRSDDFSSIQELREFFGGKELERRVEEDIYSVDSTFVVIMDKVLKKAGYGPHQQVLDVVKSLSSLCDELEGLYKLSKERLYCLRETCVEISEAYSNYSSSLPKRRRLAG